MAVGIESNELNSPQLVIRALDGIYPKDEVFKSAFAAKQLKTTDNRNKKIVRHILCEIEKKVSEVGRDENDDKFNIEHILPENPDDSWTDIDDTKVDSMTYRLGNMTLLETSSNRNAGNKSFQEKLIIYSESSLVMTKGLAKNYSKWNLNSIESRQKQLANLANSIWKISELS